MSESRAAMKQSHDDRDDRARRNRRTALLLAALAIAFYLGFIALGAINS